MSAAPDSVPTGDLGYRNAGHDLQHGPVSLLDRGTVDVMTPRKKQFERAMASTFERLKATAEAS
jgi:hypothetical protein